MSDTKIPTAKELVEKVLNRSVTDLQSYLLPNELVFSIMKEFAKQHVETALKAASKTDYVLDSSTAQQKILECYPLDNIK